MPGTFNVIPFLLFLMGLGDTGRLVTSYYPNGKMKDSGYKRNCEVIQASYSAGCDTSLYGYAQWSQDSAVIPVGRWKTYYESGRLKNIISYYEYGANEIISCRGKKVRKQISSILDGPFFSYYTNGKIKESGIYTMDKKTGNWAYLDSTGKLVADSYSNPRIVSAFNIPKDTLIRDVLKAVVSDSLNGGILTEFRVITDRTDIKWTLSTCKDEANKYLDAEDMKFIEIQQNSIDTFRLDSNLLKGVLLLSPDSVWKIRRSGNHSIYRKLLFHDDRYCIQEISKPFFSLDLRFAVVTTASCRLISSGWGIKTTLYERRKGAWRRARTLTYAQID